MDVLQAIDEFCSEHNIRYSMACGTFLGAIRHKGYIPWDDDIDIYVPREDFIRLIEDFPSLYKGRYKIISIERYSKWSHPYAKAYDSLTEMKENSAINEDIGVNIDIFPVDEVPIGKQWEKYDKKRRKNIFLFSLKFVRLNHDRSLKKNIFLLLFKTLTFWFPVHRWAKSINKKVQRFNGLGYDHYFECCAGLLQKRPFRKTLFDNLKSYQFEDREFMGFENYDEYLKNAYGDYMQLPPEDKRVSHHSFSAYWK